MAFNIDNGKGILFDKRVYKKYPTQVDWGGSMKLDDIMYETKVWENNLDNEIFYQVEIIPEVQDVFANDMGEEFEETNSSLDENFEIARNKGIMFSNPLKGENKQPDIIGEINFCGDVKRIYAYLNVSRAGNEYINILILGANNFSESQNSDKQYVQSRINAIKQQNQTQNDEVIINDDSDFDVPLDIPVERKIEFQNQNLAYISDTEDNKSTTNEVKTSTSLKTHKQGVSALDEARRLKNMGVNTRSNIDDEKSYVLDDDLDDIGDMVNVTNAPLIEKNISMENNQIVDNKNNDNKNNDNNDEANTFVVMEAPELAGDDIVVISSPIDKNYINDNNEISFENNASIENELINDKNNEPKILSRSLSSIADELNKMLEV